MKRTRRTATRITREFPKITQPVTVRLGSAGPDSWRRSKTKTPPAGSRRATRAVRVQGTFRFKRLPTQRPAAPFDAILPVLDLQPLERAPAHVGRLRVLGHQALVAALDNGGSMARLLSCSGLPARTRSPVSTGQRDRSRLSRLRCPLASIRHAVVPRPLRADGRPLPYGGSYGWGCEAHETGGAARRETARSRQPQPAAGYGAYSSA
jgi:hypothetical protein